VLNWFNNEEKMSPSREDKNLNFKVPEAELDALNTFYQAYAPACSKGDVCRIAIANLVRDHGFEYPEIFLRDMRAEIPLRRKNNAEPLPSPKAKKK
jgi:hypothetical protein